MNVSQAQKVARLLKKKYPYTKPDTSIIKNLDSKDGSFAALVLGILYALDYDPIHAEKTIQALVKLGSFSSASLYKAYQEFSKRYRIYNEQMENVRVTSIPVIQTVYRTLNEVFRRTPAPKTIAILRAAYHIENDLNGDIRNLLSECNGCGEKVVQTLKSWKAHLNIKAAWVCREMRSSGIWSDIDGYVCCVYDKQVQNSFDKLGLQNCIPLLSPQKIIWELFQEDYDIPLLRLSREKCSRNSCPSCDVSMYCDDRNG